MRVGLVAHFADIGLVRGVHVHVLLAVAAVGKAPVTSFEFTFERFLTCKRQKCKGEGTWSGQELPGAEQRETERSAIFRKRERRLGAAIASFFPGEKRRVLVKPTGLGVVRGVGQGWSRTCGSLCSRSG